MTRKRVAVLISGRGSNMSALIEAAKAKDYPAEIVLVVSNRPDAAGLARAREAAIATAVIDHRLFRDDCAAFERALAAGVKRHGATVHFVVEETDAGPVISQQSVPVLQGDTEDTLAARVLEIEHRIYPEALRLVAEGRAKFATSQPEIKNPRV